MHLVEVTKNSVLITGLVMVMMIFLEYINIISKGHSLEKLRDRPFLQILISALLGLIPGCGGGFIVVSLYAHNMVSFGALLAMMIATVGDEAFVMLAMIPGTSLYLFMGLLILAIVSGWITDKVIRRIPRPFGPDHFSIHSEEFNTHGHIRVWEGIGKNFNPPGRHRIVLLLGLALFFVCIVFGFLSHEHIQVSGHEHEHAAESMFSEKWMNMIFAGFSLVTLVFTLFSSDHFIEEHIWNHIVKQHFIKIFLWTLGALLVLEVALHYVDLQSWMYDRFWLMLLVAVIVGLIPESGPHILFISLYAAGTIPLSILLANSIVQEGHAGLPLLAETKKGFVIAKAFKVVIAVISACCIQFIYSL